MKKFEIKTTYTDHTGQPDTKTTIVSQYDIQDYFVNFPGVHEVKEYQEAKAVFWLVYAKLENKEPFCINFSTEENMLEWVEMYKNFSSPCKFKWTFERKEIKL